VRFLLCAFLTSVAASAKRQRVFCVAIQPERKRIEMNLILAANTIRGLAMDGVQKANSGHPGMPMGCADYASVLWLKFLKHDPADPKWADRGPFCPLRGARFDVALQPAASVGLSAAAGAAQAVPAGGFADAGSPGVRAHGGRGDDDGPLGAGLSNAVGMALAEAMLAAKFNKEGQTVVDHYTYAISGDGCMMEGISHEACSLAGAPGPEQADRVLRFQRDHHRGQDEPSAYSDDPRKRFEAYGLERAGDRWQ